jgi:hypothetical protein
MLWEIHQQSKIASAERSAERAESKVGRYADEVSRIGRHVDRLSLACQAMWELLRDHSDLTEEHIEAKILEIDGRDGQLDGKIGTQLCDCPDCGRPTNSRRSSCVMCGAPLVKEHKFEG